jgi:hypothetical protein
VRRRLGWTLTLVLLVAACGGDGSPTATKRSDLDRRVERELFDLLLDAGATDREAACLAIVLTSEVDEISDVLTIDNLGDNRSQPLGPRGRECGLYDRLNEIVLGIGREAEREVDAHLDRFKETLEKELLAVGARRDEAECIVEAIFDSSIDPDDEAAREERLAQCGSNRRLDQLMEQRYKAPLVEGLIEAGATTEEANCLVDHVDNIDIYFPSEDFESPTAAETTARRFVEMASVCGDANRLRALAFALHGQVAP